MTSKELLKGPEVDLNKLIDTFAHKVQFCHALEDAFFAGARWSSTEFYQLQGCVEVTQDVVCSGGKCDGDF